MSMSLDKFFIRETLTIKDSLAAISKSGYNTIFVADSNGKLKGSLTDGDIRRALLTNATTLTKITNI